MAFTPKSDEEAAQAVTRLVDGTLSDAERDEVEAWADASPDIARQVAAQRQISRAVATDGPATPERLLDAIAERYRASGRSPQGSGGGRSAPQTGRARTAWIGWRPVAAFGTLAALVVVIVISTSLSTSSPNITAAAKLAFVPATAPAPSASNGTYLDVSYGGVTFPNYARLDAIPTGQITNRIGGRPALTVFYRLKNGARLSYTVFSGRPVALPAAARIVRYEGVPLRTYRTSDGLSVVTLVRHGRTCVLAAQTGQSVVLGLAAEPVLVQHV